MFERILQVIHDHKDECLVLVSLSAVLVSLLTAVLAPLVQLRIARLNASTTTLTTNRIKWIEAMQTDIATYTALLERTEFLQKSMQVIHEKYPKLNPTQQEDFNRMHREYDEKTYQRNALGNLIGIRFDISSEKRRLLFGAISELAHATPGVATDAAAAGAAMGKIQQIARDLLEEEWSRVERDVGRIRR